MLANMLHNLTMNNVFQFVADIGQGYSLCKAVLLTKFDKGGLHNIVIDRPRI